jgi:hypothetical protein
MSRGVALSLVCCVLTGAVVGGCGRPTLPGKQFEGGTTVTGSSEEPTGPLPEEPVIEMGDPEAKVRIEAFFPINEGRQPLIDLLKRLVEQYPGKLYVRYADYRTPEGRALRSAVRDTPGGISVLQVNGKTQFEVAEDPNPYRVNFLQDMGRFWAADDLRAVVAQEVAAAYGETSAGK